jgi:hypothetical protein
MQSVAYLLLPPNAVSIVAEVVDVKGREFGLISI